MELSVSKTRVGFLYLYIFMQSSLVMGGTSEQNLQKKENQREVVMMKEKSAGIWQGLFFLEVLVKQT